MTSRYVAIEGVDGAGKSTVSEALAESLREQGHDVLVVREPGGTRAGEAIREILLGPASQPDAWAEALLFAAARSQLASELVGPALDEGRVVISDRSVYSSLAYQGGGRGLGVDRVREVNAAGLQGVWPGTVILLHLDPAAGLEREDEADRISVEGIDLQRRVAKTYDELAEAEPDRFVVIDAAVGIDEVVRIATLALEKRW